MEIEATQVGSSRGEVPQLGIALVRLCVPAISAGAKVAPMLLRPI
jgi:hypothetical protein